MTKVEKRIMDIVSSHSKITGDLSAEDQLSKIGIDSLEKVELIVELEDEFLVCFEDSMLIGNKIKTIGDLFIMVNSCIDHTN